MNRFSFAGKSSRAFGLYITGQPFVGAQKDIVSYEVPGRSGDHIAEMGRFKNVQVTYEAFVHDRLAQKTREIKAWLLAAKGYQLLYDTYDLHYLRYACYEGPFELEQSLCRFGRTAITFNCKPHLYSRTGLKTHTILAPGTLLNPEPCESLPHITVYGEGSGRLYINGSMVRFGDIPGTLGADSELGIWYSGTQNMSASVTGDLPVFLPGRNEISWSGGITHIETIPRWCTL